ncbi:bifunctional diaminohydroxyphosphoribosylaminopyrimidine deaminase/5-amino-6-(5-phosphoribosylamino)uracil reductase RibD [Paraliobacillus sp. X-1268]|uniref:bifunctional diaminohydroxyphosphoribosylaminopyrimidine deaminase/5-amino-6-(5-phosphoribosylamino)uracil reductase RibD n=1 Tax=Paraliobacillus sp. X-1268 TaxID=2213193 RepID=UPI001E4268AC|nr:bifunctional diaminohydroxyphosphoribosylaminopyrimidine deaminase/5-amino-6-(5-phosphoribosylamino)uracil reductase RibD [Paraliobacillus sp. X-1268]
MTKETYMDLALSLATSTIGQTSPNPSVGSVVVKDGRIIGMGSHLKAGEGHAEVLAMQQAGEEAEGSDVYVTLEPCAHYGKTPPCAELLVQRKVKKVYIACVDPNPEVAGKGIEILKKAGIEVEVGLKEERALKINQYFFYYMKNKRPFVTLKAAMTLDGKTATATGDSKWITSEEAREDVHKQRAIHDAIMVGSNTIKQDDPRLTTRLPQGGKNPIRIILDTNLMINPDAKILDNEATTWIICGKNADTNDFQRKHAHVKLIQLQTEKLEITAVLDILGEHGIQSLYVEGGSTLHGSFVREGLFQECHWYIAPKLLAGSDAISVVGGISPNNMKEAIDLDIKSIEQVGPDIKIIARPLQEGD